MATPQEVAASFARALDLFRDPGARAEQKAQFRTLANMLKTTALTLAAQDGRLVVNGTPVDGGTLLPRLELHSVHQIEMPVDPPLVEVFELLKALAEQPISEDVSNRLRDANGDKRITVTMHTPQLRPPPPPPPPPQQPAREVAGSAQLNPDADLAAGGREASTTSSTAAVTAQLLEEPDGPQVGELLATLGRHLERAMKSKKTTQALMIIAAIIRAEQQVTDATRRRQYSIMLKRMYSKALLEAVAEVANHPADRDDALLVLRRAGEDGVEVLLDLLVAAPTIEERRGIFMALTGIKEGTDQLVHMLGHRQWFVVRNVAELAGELALNEAVPALAQQLDHDDERVRKAVALALAKIGSSAAAEPLRRALRDKSPEVRMHAAIGVGPKSSALAMTLVVAMEEEEDEGVERELILALGRIGSPSAVQALIKFAQPGGRVFGRKPTALRVTAVEALRLAATPAAVGTLEGLTEDGDRQVRAAAKSAVKDLKQ